MNVDELRQETSRVRAAIDQRQEQERKEREAQELIVAQKDYKEIIHQLENFIIPKAVSEGKFTCMAVKRYYGMSRAVGNLLKDHFKAEGFECYFIEDPSFAAQPTWSLWISWE